MTTLEAIPLFLNLEPSELQALRLITQEKQFPAGQDIFQEGAPGDGVYFIKSGTVEISTGNGERRVFSRLGEGATFGEMAIIEQRPRSATATAVEVTEVYFVPRRVMLAFIEHCPRVAFAMLQQISHRLREFNQLHVRELVQAENLALIGRFAQGIVHDLKNPLNIIGLCAEIFGRNPESDALARARIRKQVIRINDMVGDILIFTRGTQKNAELKPVHFAGFIQELVTDLNAEVTLKGVHVEVPTPPPAVDVMTDAHRLNRVFFNLVGNATDMMLSGGKIFLRFHLQPGELVIEIEDTGPGIAPEIADKLFQPFATHGKAHGTGLGLSICKKIIEDQGGRIWARSQPGHGAIFCFTLPLAK